MLVTRDSYDKRAIPVLGVLSRPTKITDATESGWSTIVFLPNVSSDFQQGGMLFPNTLWPLAIGYLPLVV